MLMLVLISCAFLLVAALTVKAWRGDRRTDLRRCPRCWYDMSATDSLKCPECGHTTHRELDLYQRRVSKRLFSLGLVGMCALAVAGVYVVTPGPWTSKVPRPLMKIMLNIAAPLPAPPSNGTGLPVPTATFRYSEKPWERLVWHYQASISFDVWADAVLATRGPITAAELARLAPLAEQVSNLYAERGGTRSADAWASEDPKPRLASARVATPTNDPDKLLRLEWALSELQFAGWDYSHLSDFARTPDSIIQQSLIHSSPTVRVFGITRFGRRIQQVVITPQSPMPPGRGLVESMAKSDPDATVRYQADLIFSYADGFLPKK